LRKGFPVELFNRLKVFGIGDEGQSIVDLGTGTGTLARSFAKQGCQVIGVDPDSRMLEQAHRLSEQESLSVEFIEGSAEAIALESSSADVVTAGQCWHWFDAPKSLNEIKRVLISSGKLVIAHFDWIPLTGSVVELTESLIEKANSSWNYGGGNGLHGHFLNDIATAGFKNIETFSFDLDVDYTHEAWVGRIHASAGIASLSEETRHAFNLNHLTEIKAKFPGDSLAVPHRVFAIIASIE
jgi:ubiquinone/menaquinone biosynthesis C-methylase UbiE